MFWSRLFWIAFGLFSAVSATFAFLYFPTAFPLVTVDLQMDRSLALQKSRALADSEGWGPEGYRQAASFDLDTEVQNFVELEAGGRGAFAKMLSEGLYFPYTWSVRHFRESETLETWIRFTPAGVPCGFRQKLPDEAQGASLPRDEALSIAEQTAVRSWAIQWTDFELVESSQEIRPGGRTDHTFVYRRRTERIGEGEYRLRLVVGGDRLTELTHFVKVPEAFSRRYEEMRSVNNAITQASLVATVILYIIGGCLVGLFYLLRKRWVIWKSPIVWGFSISLLQVLTILNQWPLLWMSYDTALSAQSYVLQLVVQLLLTFVGLGTILSLSFMAAEGLTRRAFGEHIQLWRLWSKGTAATTWVAGRTVGGYLLVASFFAYEVGLYFLASNWLGWWTPSSSLFDPNVLATYFPWLTSIAVSLQAGFWEECLFRAVPIAGAALLGDRWGGRRAWIAAALVVQALVFGAGHASYPAQPAYARVAELILPSIFFGLLYIRFGLLATIVLHFTFDVVWMALPLFVSRAPGVWLDQTLVVGLALIPLGMVLVARLRGGGWQTLGEEVLNRSWQPRPAPPPVEEAQVPSPRLELPHWVHRSFLAAGALGLIAWPMLTDFEPESPPLRVGRDEALASARRALAERGVELGPPWRASSDVRGGVDDADRFIWREGGEEAYRELLGTYLEPPHWWIRFARFEGDVAERAEEYGVAVGPEGRVKRIQHVLPEAKPGASLTEEQARTSALSVIDAKYGLSPGQIEEISAQPSKHPGRDDWTVIFADRAGYPLDEGEARVSVTLAGDEVADFGRWIYVPEEWERRERERRTIADIVRLAGWGLISALLGGGVVAAIIAWSRGRFLVRAFLGWFAFLCVSGFMEAANGWPSVEARFSTAQSFALQVAVRLGLTVVSVLVAAAAPALILGYLHHRAEGRSSWIGKGNILLGLSTGALGAAVLAGAQMLAPTSVPLWPDYDPSSAFFPSLAVVLGSITGLVGVAAFLMLVFAAADDWSRGWQRRRGWVVAFLLVTGMALAGVAADSGMGIWLATGVTTGVVLLGGYVVLARFDLGLVPLAVAMWISLEALEAAVRPPYPGALAGAVLSSVLVMALSILWSRRLTSPRSRETEEHPPS